ncbi:glycosyltransferase family 4 protein [Phytomonospora sp. NPDC050363]|uniref:glycosyltransferase family 4 protein n=1 Tax=Phytomonospora sp. NPDC050363 TaxID=3155642 RepID=UPI0033EEA9AF
MRIAVFTEDDQARQVAAEFRRAAEAAGHVVDELTPALVGPEEAIGEVDLPHELEARVRAFTDANGVDRLVLCDDQSHHGRQLTRGLRTRLPVVVIQDRHVDYRHRSLDAAAAAHGRLGDSGPATVCVWGPATRRALAGRGPDTAVVVTGALGLSDDPALLRAARSAVHRRAAAPGTPLRVVIHGDGDWDEAVEELRAYGEVEFGGDPAGADLVVTATDALYPRTLRAGVPLVHHRPAATGGRVLPSLRHNLIRTTGDVGELGEVALRLKVDGRFRGDPAGEPVEHYLAFHADVGERIVDAVVRAQVPAAGSVVDGPTVDRRSLAERALDDIRDRIRRPRSLAVIGTDFGYVTGVAVPVLTYTRDLVAEGPVDVRYIDIWAFSSVEGVLAAIEGCEQVLVNSLALFWRNWLGSRVVAALLDARVPTSVYVHETEYVFDHEAATRGVRHERLLDLLPRLRLLCVSRAQADFYRKHGARDPVVVYNTVPLDDHPPRARKRAGERPRIAMVGTVQDRKGVDLFSRVAERAAALPWDFAWYGHRGRVSDTALVSTRVDWRGALPRRRVRAELAEADVLFLSSSDDPMPLAVIEAVQQRLRIVTYDRVGSKEILQGVGGYRGFGEYTPDAALTALREVLADDVDEAGYREVEELFAPASFAERMSTALALAKDGPAPRVPAPTVGALDDATGTAHAEHLAALRAEGRPADAELYERALLRRRD